MNSQFDSVMKSPGGMGMSQDVMNDMLGGTVTAEEPVKTESRLSVSSQSSEMAVLCCMMVNPDSASNVSLREEDFHFEENKILFDVLSRLIDAGDPVDVISVAEQCKFDNVLSQAGDIGYISRVAMLGSEPESIKRYTTLVKEHAKLRRLRLLSSQIAKVIDKQSSSEAISLIESSLDTMTADDDIQKKGFTSVGSVTDVVMEGISMLASGEIESTGLKTGFDGFDEVTTGLQPADLIILAGRPSMGKTTFAMNIAENVAMNGNHVAVFSLEMPSEALSKRSLSSLGRVDAHKVRTGRGLDSKDWGNLAKASSILSSISISIDDTAGLPLSEFRKRARRLHRELPISLIVIDYLQLMRHPSKSGNRTEEISEISRGLKAVAKELNVPVIALSQLNRSLEQRPNKRPINSDLRESGSIEQDADLIVFVYRDEVYNSDSPDKGKAEIIIGKQRNGPLATIATGFEGKYSRFYNLNVTSNSTTETQPAMDLSEAFAPEDDYQSAEDDFDIIAENTHDEVEATTSHENQSGDELSPIPGGARKTSSVRGIF